MNKHAYLIMAHNNWKNLEKLILLLDDERNDIYIHIDKKTDNFDYQKYFALPKKSKLKIYSEIKVYWGDYSQIECELYLIKKAAVQNYSYYHVLSGSDLPIKSQDYIHNFFNKNSGCEFVHYSSTEDQDNYKDVLRRISIYHFLQIYRKKFAIPFVNAIFTYIDKILILLQIIFKVNRLKSDLEIRYGSQWVSITNDLVQYLIENEKSIYRTYSKSGCADELFIQTIVYNSEFKTKLYNNLDDDFLSGNLRLIDWERGNGKGNPYVWRKSDFSQLINSECLFARKFDYHLDYEIVELIYDEFKN